MTNADTGGWCEVCSVRYDTLTLLPSPPGCVIVSLAVENDFTEAGFEEGADGAGVAVVEAEEVRAGGWRLSSISHTH